MKVGDDGRYRTTIVVPLDFTPSFIDAIEYLRAKFQTSTINAIMVMAVLRMYEREKLLDEYDALKKVVEQLRREATNETD